MSTNWENLHQIQVLHKLFKKYQNLTLQLNKYLVVLHVFLQFLKLEHAMDGDKTTTIKLLELMMKMRLKIQRL